MVKSLIRKVMTEQEKECRVMRLVDAVTKRNDEGERKQKMYPVWTPSGVELFRKMIAVNRD